jgi:hypothetical protein
VQTRSIRRSTYVQSSSFVIIPLLSCVEHTGTSVRLAFTGTNSVDSPCTSALCLSLRQITPIPTLTPAFYLFSPGIPPLPPSKSVPYASRDKYRQFPANVRFRPFHTKFRQIALRSAFPGGAMRSMPSLQPCFCRFRRQMPLTWSPNEKEGEGNRSWTSIV